MSAVGIREVAAQSQVSPGTVSNFLNHPDKVAPETAARIRAAIAALGYVGNSAARQLRIGASTTIAHLALEVGTPGFADFAQGVEERASEIGYSVLIANSGGSTAREASYLDLFESQRVRGILLSAVGAHTDRVVRLAERGIPTVAVGRRADTATCSSVSIDDEEGGRLAVEHLLQIGCRRIMVIGGPFDIETIADRLEGAQQAVSAVSGAEIEIVEVGARSITAGRAAGEMLRSRPAEDRPDGVFAVNDLLAVGILHALTEEGSVRVPEDVALVGYGDIEFAADAVIPLTSIRRQSDMFGRTALDLLHQEIAQGPGGRHHRVAFHPELVVRQSTVGRTGEQPGVSNR
ncbi:LacI family DNA-binding transcriptional regulator [Ruania alba]|uniref:Transcriptional regulator, LacI family n=1 Tax=Ruania alba TaxID=648782 RepID=A0A1H5N9I2_9MICO|nr:substrate-binding domain-containing protein [Ruania alba]SEE97527.1 transcriptional regulator, LacI family [Ruania alba]